MSHTRMTNLTVILSELFPLDHAILCPLYNLNALWNLIMILHSYVEQVMMVCHVQEIQLSLSYFLKFFPLDGFRCNFVYAP